MYRTLRAVALPLAALVLFTSPAAAGLPGFCFNAETEPPPAGCQFRFHPDGQLDELLIHVTLRDAFCTPVANCSTSATVHANVGTLEFCSCEPVRQTGFSDHEGVIDFRYSRLGGRGDLSIGITAHCSGNIAIADLPITFTSPDLDGSCESAPAVAVTVIDLAHWAFGLGAYQLASDLNCDGEVTVIDLGMWATGLGWGCP